MTSHPPLPAKSIGADGELIKTKESIQLFHSSPHYHPTTVTRFVRNFDTGAQVVLVDTDAGLSYLKAMGSKEGPHVLACELIGTRLADILGLPTFDYALLTVDELDEIPFAGSADRAHAGPAFATRAEKGMTWGRDKQLLRRISNIDDISRLVVFDTLIRNFDRYGPNGCRINPDNVFLSEESTAGLESVELRVMDHSHCFTNGRDLTGRVADIGNVQDDRIYGLFPEFREFLNEAVVASFCEDLLRLDSTTISSVIELVPIEWSVPPEAKNGLGQFLLRRAQFVSDRIEEGLFSVGRKPQKRLPFDEGQ